MGNIGAIATLRHKKLAYSTSHAKAHVKLKNQDQIIKESLCSMIKYHFGQQKLTIQISKTKCPAITWLKRFVRKY